SCEPPSVWAADASLIVGSLSGLKIGFSPFSISLRNIRLTAACAWATETSGLTRPMMISQKESIWSCRAFHRGIRLGRRDKGTHRSYLLESVRASNFGSVTPTITKGTPFRRMVLPIADCEPPKALCQKL